MREAKRWVARLALVVTAALVVFGCSASSGPSKDEVAIAFQAMDSPMTTASFDTGVYAGNPPTYADSLTNPSGAGGTVSFSFTSSADPTAGPYTITGTVTITNWKDLDTGYTINGTLTTTITDSRAMHDIANYPQTQTVTISWDFALSGGTISTLSGDIEITTYEVSFASFPDITMTGSMTANGHRFDMSEFEE